MQGKGTKETKKQKYELVQTFMNEYITNVR